MPTPPASTPSLASAPNAVPATIALDAAPDDWHTGFAYHDDLSDWIRPASIASLGQLVPEDLGRTFTYSCEVTHRAEPATVSTDGISFGAGLVMRPFVKLTKTHGALVAAGNAY